MNTTARFNLKPNAADKDILARTLIDSESRITLSQGDFAAFTAAIDQGFVPNAALQNALQAAAGLHCRSGEGREN